MDGLIPPSDEEVRFGMMGRVMMEMNVFLCGENSVHVYPKRGQTAFFWIGFPAVAENFGTLDRLWTELCPKQVS